MVQCPIDCIRSGCPDKDFLEKHSEWLLTIIGLFTACVGSVLTFMLKSRCKRIKCFGFACDRNPIELNAGQINVQSA